jgi:hypothetical protein
MTEDLPLFPDDRRADAFPPSREAALARLAAFLPRPISATVC